VSAIIILTKTTIPLAPSMCVALSNENWISASTHDKAVIPTHKHIVAIQLSRNPAMAKAAAMLASVGKKRTRPPSQSGRYPRGKRAGTWKIRMTAAYKGQVCHACQRCTQLETELEAAMKKCSQLELALLSSNKRCLQLAAAMGTANQKAAKSGTPCIVVQAIPPSWASA